MPRNQTSIQTLDISARLASFFVMFAAWLLLIAVPLVWSTLSTETFRGPKNELAGAAMAILAAMFIAFNLKTGVWRGSLWLAWGGIVAGGMISALFCSQPLRSLTSLLPLVLALLGWGALRQLDSNQQKRLLRWIIWSGVLVSFLTLVFLSPTARPSGFTLQEPNIPRYAWIGCLGNPSDVGCFLVLPALLAIALALEKGRYRWLYGSAAVLMIGVLFGTRTITALLALIVGGVALAWPRFRRNARVWLAIGAVAALALFFAIGPYAQRLRGAMIGTVNSSLLWLGSGRGAGFSAATAMVKNRPFTGVGYGLFEAHSFQLQSLDALAERGRVLGMVTGFGQAHNEFLQHAAETGLVGVAIAIAGLVFAWRKRSEGKGELPAIPALAVAAVVIASAQFPLHLAANASQWIVLAALAAPSLSPPILDRRARLLGLLVVGVLAGTAGTLAMQRFTADATINRGKLLISGLRSDGQSAQLVAVANSGLPHLERAKRWLPFDWNAEIVLGNVAVEARNYDLAFVHFTKALALAPRPETQYNVGLVELMRGNRTTAIGHLVQAVKFNPAIFRKISDPELARSLRRALDAEGYGVKHPWMFIGTPAATP